MIARPSRWFFLAVFGAFLLPLMVSAEAFTVTCETGDDTSKVAGTPAMVYVPDITIPGFTASQKVTISGDTLGLYIRGLFVVMVWTVSVLAVVMIIYGGIKWVAAAGDAGRINDAKDVVMNSVIGLVIALTSVVLLQIINPQLINLTDLTNLVKPVNKCSLSVLQQLVEKSGKLEAKCASGLGTPEPDTVCFATPGVPCITGLNQLIKQAASYTRSDGHLVSVDPIMMKAILLGEAANQGKTTLVSGPTAGRACKQDTPRCKLKGSAYGIIQMTHATMIANWERVSGSVPAACGSENEAVWRQSSGSLAADCARILDNGKEGILLQLKMMASEISEVATKKILNDNPTYIAGAYHLGSGGIEEYLRTGEARSESSSASVAYLKAFNERFHSICIESAVQNYENDRPGTARE